MLGKQWLNRYLQPTGRSAVKRCGNRQRKFSGLEKWRFHLFIESLPVMLQIALLLLTCGLSWYMWSINTSVAHVVISFTALGILFYIGIVVAGISSYACPFQTPVSTAIWYLRYRFGQQIRYQLRQISQASRIAKHRLAKRLLRIWGAGPLLTTHKGIYLHPPIPQSGLSIQSLMLKPNLRQNAADSHCICWFFQNSWSLQNITIPEAIDSAICLAGTTRWFNSNSISSSLLFPIVDTFMSCFDSAEQLYPGMRNRAYFSARALLQINVGARAEHLGGLLGRFIPAISSSPLQHTDPDFHHILFMLDQNLDPDRPSLNFPWGNTHTLSHLLWVSNLFVDMAYIRPDSTLRYCQSYLSVAASNHHTVIVNTLIMWYMLLGGHIEEDTLWATNRLYVMVSSSFLSAHLKLYMPVVHCGLSSLTCQ